MNKLSHWAPAICGMICLACGAGLIGIFGFFVEPLSAEFSVGVATLNIAPVALILAPGIVAPFVGRFVDVLPIKRIMLLGTLAAMASLALASQAPSLALAGVAFAAFAVSLTLYGPVVVNGLLVKLYQGDEGKALSIAALGISVATISLPPVVGFMLENLNWRVTLLALSLALLAILWLSVWLWVPPGVLQSQTPEASEKGGAFFRQPAFWFIGICVALGFNAAILLAICYPPHFLSLGFDVTDAGWFVSVAGAAGFVGKLVVGALADLARDRIKWLVAAIVALQVAGLLWLMHATQALPVAAAVAMLGFGGGAFIPMHPYLNSRYFDVSVVGRVNGAQMPLFLPVGLVGAPLAGYVYDQQGSYYWVLGGLALLQLIAAAFVLALPKPGLAPSSAAH